MSLWRCLALALLATQLLPSLQAQTRTVALTIDDLPFVSGRDHASPADAKAAAAANRKLLRQLLRRHVPVTGFVIERAVEELGPDAGAEILRQWVNDGFDLGNHSYSHPDFNSLDIDQSENQIIRGEATIVPLMSAAGRKVQYFRFPANHTGNTKEKHDELSDFLAKRGYRLAPCTIENSDWLFNSSYEKMLAQHDRASAARLRASYLAYTSAEIDFLSAMNKQVLGYEPPEIMLIHDNQLNADVIKKLLAIFADKGYTWVTLTQAESDPVYQSPAPFIARLAKYGPMWGFRWAAERGIKVNGALEPDPPKWVTDYAR